VVERILRLPVRHTLPVGIRVREARGIRARLLGLALLHHLDPNDALLFRRCRSVHTFGMRFPIDVVFLDRDGRVLRLARNVGPRRIVSCRAAAAAIEVRAGEGDRLRVGLSLWRARGDGS
jgi:uncharacterized membrane protein (UPF0127 family)